MFTIDEDSTKFLREKLTDNQFLRVFFGGYGWGGPSMGLALDELKEGDEQHLINELPLVVDPFAMKIIKESGGLAIKSSIFGPMAELVNTGSDGGCGSGCSCG